jgi:predicted RNase H-like nuclease (RuvC/YqgF family)
MDDNFGSIADIDAKLDAEFGTVANEPEEDLTPAENEVDTGVDEATEEVVDNADTQDEEEEPQEQNPQIEEEAETKSEKKDHHAFANLRAENSNLKKEKEALEADSSFLKDLAASYGYTDTDAFVKAYKEAQMQKEAKEKGYDPELYRQNMEQRERIEALEKQREQDLMDRKLERFKGALDNATALYNISEEEIFERLEKSGLDVNTILSVPNPKLLLDGLLVDRIQAHAKQSQIQEQNNMKGLVEDKNEDGGVDKTITIDSLLKDDLAKYKADNFFE